MKQIIITVSDDATNFDVFEAVFGFSSVFNAGNQDRREVMSCRFEEDDTKHLVKNRLSKTWGNSQFELSDWVKQNESATIVNCEENDNATVN